ncbi:hypothetical protein HPB47_008161, partial [Ixodes persulcatus]
LYFISASHLPMDVADDGVGWTPTTSTPRLHSPGTIIVKLTGNTNWASVSPTTIGQAVQQSARLTKQNCDPVNTPWQWTHITTLPPPNSLFFNNSLSKANYIPPTRQKTSLLVTIKGPTFSRHSILCSTVFRLYLPRPNSQQCRHCFSLEHRSLVCPNRAEFVCSPPTSVMTVIPDAPTVTGNTRQQTPPALHASKQDSPYINEPGPGTAGTFILKDHPL